MNRYKSIAQTTNRNSNIRTLGLRYYTTNFYPEIPLKETDIYVITSFGDRLEALAQQFYKDQSLYWIIAAANPNEVSFGSITVPEGTQLRIPIDIANIVDSYNQLNSL